MKIFLIIFLLLRAAHAGEVVVIGNANVPKMDLPTLVKVYTGRVVMVSGISITPFGLKLGSEIRNRFMQDILNQEEDKYIAYWTVRRYIGKGSPPTEFSNVADLISYVKSTPGAIGYIYIDDLKYGMNVVARK